MKKEAKAADRRARKARKRAIQSGEIPDPRDEYGERIDPAFMQPEAFQAYPTQAERREMRERAAADADREEQADNKAADAGRSRDPRAAQRPPRPPRPSRER